jgi:uncharacterized protein (TIGR02453 family)
MAVIDPTFKDLEAKDCIFRINRDIRFSKDKQPYKLQVSAIINPEGKKSKAVNGVYFELGPEKMRVYGGVYEIDKEDLLIAREGIAAAPEKFKKAYQDPKFVKVFGNILTATAGRCTDAPCGVVTDARYTRELVPMPIKSRVILNV